MKRPPRIESKQGKPVEKFGLCWTPTTPELWMHMQIVANGGQWKKQDGELAGEGMLYHFQKGIGIIWPHIAQHRWFDFFLKEWIPHDYVAVMGPKSSGKTCSAALCHLFDYYCHANCTTVIVCSDTLENLEDRIWGEIKKLHRMAKENFSWLPGNLIEGRRRLVTDMKSADGEGRDFRNGMVGIPVKRGSETQSLASFVGRKNKRVRICGDELSLLNKSFIDAIASQANQEVKITGMGNPSQTTDALGLLAEPHTDLGGWDGGIDQTPKTKSWRTRWPNGICIQLPGRDCPNMDVPEDEPVPFPYLITRKQIEDGLAIWGAEDWHAKMFIDGMLPRGQGANRVITRQLCIKHGAMKDPMWKNTNRRKAVGIDAAYRSVGGDRCVLVTIEYGEEAEISDPNEFNVTTLIQQDKSIPRGRQILALISVDIIPIRDDNFGDPEDQIVMFTKAHCEKNNISAKDVWFDSGMRTALVSAFARLWSVDVNPIDSMGRPSEMTVSENIDVKCCDYYSKLVTEFWYSVRHVIEAGQFRGMTEDVMLEGCSREYKRVGANKIEVETKKEMKEKLGRSPDLFDALCYAVNGARRSGFSIRRLANPTIIEQDHRWKKDLRRKHIEAMKAHSLVPT